MIEYFLGDEWPRWALENDLLRALMGAEEGDDAAARKATRLFNRLYPATRGLGPIKALHLPPAPEPPKPAPATPEEAERRRAQFALVKGVIK